MSNALQAVLDRAAKEPEGKPSRPPAAAAPRPAAKRQPPLERAATAPDQPARRRARNSSGPPEWASGSSALTSTPKSLGN